MKKFIYWSPLYPIFGLLVILYSVLFNIHLDLCIYDEELIGKRTKYSLIIQILSGIILITILANT